MPSGRESEVFRSDPIVQKLTVADYAPGILPFEFNFYRTYIVPQQFDSIKVQILTDSFTQLATANMNLRFEIRPGDFMNIAESGIPIPSNLFAFITPHIDIVTLGMGANGMQTFASNAFNPDGVNLIPWNSTIFGIPYNTVVPINQSIILVLNATGVDATVNFAITTFVEFFRT